MNLAAKLIKEARSVTGLTQAELARRAHTSQSAIAAYEASAKVPTTDTLDRLLQAAGVSIGIVRPPAGLRNATGVRELLRRRRNEVLEVAAKNGATNVRVFGSVARGEEQEGSDVDLLVDMDLGSSLLDQVRLRRALSELLGVEVDVVASGGLLDRDAAILREATPV